MTVNRMSGLAMLLFALAMAFLVIPAHTETVGSGWMKPDTLPLACCVALAVLGIAHVIRGGGTTALDAREMLRFLGALLIVAACLWVMSRFGFLPGAIAAMIALMLASGERRPLLVGPVAIAVPAATWLIIEHMLARSLP
ncbi:hypothetical protein FQ775_07960 [Nitratireductor mangrovi]|uniref:DUF1468 domain-containing protein n=1 Tax=Nitratireductor mangrovi TaxID=2599600 RepID=A0A5B8KX74_9HYPH|nr:tripartite tricarboxylate transporter TctB family protein [Nitratireductor mangrovi]QDZ00317.2 hypothetical protein FQ775_07960 [Nitratireductor mangrovi]